MAAGPLGAADRLRYPSREAEALRAPRQSRESFLSCRAAAARAAAFLVAVVAGTFVAAVAGADLTIGLGADVTALDPHYHNVTPNNNVAAHVFGCLVQRNEKSQLEPGLATE